MFECILNQRPVWMLPWLKVLRCVQLHNVWWLNILFMHYSWSVKVYYWYLERNVLSYMNWNEGFLSWWLRVLFLFCRSSAIYHISFCFLNCCHLSVQVHDVWFNDLMHYFKTFEESTAYLDTQVIRCFQVHDFLW